MALKTEILEHVRKLVASNAPLEDRTVEAIAIALAKSPKDEAKYQKVIYTMFGEKALDCHRSVVRLPPVPLERLDEILQKAGLTRTRGIHTSYEVETEVFVEVRGKLAQRDEEKQTTVHGQKILPLDGDRTARMTAELRKVLAEAGYEILATRTYTVEYLVLAVERGESYAKQEQEHQDRKSEEHWRQRAAEEQASRDAERARDPWKYDRDNDPTR